jgi:DNA-binding XRE family transcriptional regulator
MTQIGFVRTDFSQKSHKSIFALYVCALEIGSIRLKTLRSRRHRELCDALVSARKAAGMSQHELASHLRTSQTVIARIELGERRIDVVEFIDLTRALRIDPHQLLDGLMSWPNYGLRLRKDR